MMVCTAHKRVYVQTSFVAFLCAYYYFDPAHTFYCFLTAAFLHEAGHLAVLRCLGMKVYRLKLCGSGAQLMTQPLSYFQEFAAAAGGPCVNFILLLLFLERKPIFALVNLCLLAYNLLPIMPLDGGRMLHCLLFLLFPARAAAIVERMVMFLTVSALITAAIGLTCVRHVGLWPILLAAAILLRVSETIVSEKTNLACFCG